MQVVLAIVLLIAALSYLGWQFYGRFIKKNAKCDSCAFGTSAHVQKEKN